MENVMDKGQLVDFLKCLREGPECAALVASRESYDRALREVSSQGFAVTNVYEAAIDLLTRGESVAIKAGKELPSDLYDLIRQYSQRKGTIQLLPKGAEPLSLLQLDTRVTKLLLVVPAEHEAAYSKRYPELLDLVGMVERV